MIRNKEKKTTLDPLQKLLPIMNTSLKDLLSGPLQKVPMVALLKSDASVFEQAIVLACEPDEKTAWRAAWVLYHAMSEKDIRLQSHLAQLIHSLQGKRDGHQRELLKIIEKLDCDEDHEGELFDVCMSIWEQVSKSPSVRITAFRLICRIVAKYPDLKQEMNFIAQDHYIESLSPGIKASVERMRAQMGV